MVVTGHRSHPQSLRTNGGRQAIMTEDVPKGWPAPSADHMTRSRAAAIAVLRDMEAARDRLGSFYDPMGNYSGLTFANAAPVVPDEINAADLYAVALLELEIRPAAARRVLGRTFAPELGAIPTDLHLHQADAAALVSGEALYKAVWRALRNPNVEKSDPWVMASKLCARKRPALMPVRDHDVRALLGLADVRDRRISWQIYRHLMQDTEIFGLVMEARGDIPDTPLRILDAVLWTRTDEDRRSL